MRRHQTTSLDSLLAAPDVPVHPLKMLLLKKGVSLAQAAQLFGWSLRKLNFVVQEWRRPRDAEEIARQLGCEPDELFPTR